MRTFPKSLAQLQQIVKERGKLLRNIALEDLKQLANQPDECIRVGSRPATISVVVHPQDDGSVRVVVQGFMKARLLPGKHVAVDGFYKHGDGTVASMNTEELYNYD